MKTMDADSIDSIVSDPPYGIDFMGKGWDHGVPCVEFWKEAIRVAKPGAYLLAFGGTRTFHRLTVAIEDAGWEIRDCVMWVYGSGFPKSHDVSKSIDKAAGIEREDKFEGSFERHAGPTGNKKCDKCGKWLVSGSPCQCPRPQDAPQSEAAAQWEGWGTALKPAWEPIIVARKPFVGTVAANVLVHGTGAINIDACRVGDTVETWPKTRSYGGGTEYAFTHTANGVVNSQSTGAVPAGRWPANLIHDGSDEVTAGFPHLHGSGNKSDIGTGVDAGYDASSYEISYNGRANRDYGSKGGSATRFFYCAKASKADRDEGCEGMPTHDIYSEAKPCADRDNIKQGQMHNNHPTVKPTALMRYLCKLVTPLNGIILDPFMGSGSTGKAATLERFNFIGIDLNAEYVAIAQARIDAATKQIAEQLQYGSS